MKFYRSTRGGAAVGAPEAILAGIAPDGGLYTPEEFPAIDLNALSGASALAISSEILYQLLGDFSREEMETIVRQGYAGKFATEELTPLLQVGNQYVLELFHGPTSAFKDVALSILPRLLSASREKMGVREEIVILTATSGDTGKAALEGFRDVPGTRIAVFYPHGGVSDVQYRQMATQEGANVRVCAVRGNFDDAQTGVKRIFADDRKNRWAAAKKAVLSSANSINLGRLAPQVAYYFKAYLDLVRRGAIAMGETINFAVPTGNFGDILAGEFARRMGLPVEKLICASNRNNVLTDFIRTGIYDRRRAFYKTASPSMDILVSSNLERYLYLAGGGDAALVSNLMQALESEGVYRAPESLMQEMRAHFLAGSADDAAAFRAIAEVWEKEGYLLDPHTAVAWSVAQACGDNGKKTVVLSTASPYKFSRDVLTALGAPAEDGFQAMDALFARTGIPIPRNLADLRALPILHRDVVEKDRMLSYVKEAVL